VSAQDRGPGSKGVPAPLYKGRRRGVYEGMHRAGDRRRRVAAGLATLVVLLAGTGIAWMLRTKPANATTAPSGAPAGPLTAAPTGPATDSSARSCPGGSTTLVVAAPPETAPTLTALAAQHSTTAVDEQGRCVLVQVSQLSAGQTVEALVAGWPDTAGPRPDVWVPSDDLWLGLLEQRLAAAQRSTLVPPAASTPRLASTPTVVAMPKPMAEALGWPGTPVSWSRLFGLATDPAGWASAGHPEWGAFRLGKSNPTLSGAGLDGTLAAYYAAVRRTSGLTRADIADARTRHYVAGVEQSVVRYGDSTAALLAGWAQADQAGEALSYLSALVTEESLVAAYNAGLSEDSPTGQRATPKVPLVALAPSEGSFTSDIRYAVLQAPWVDAAKRTAAAGFLATLTGDAGRRAFAAAYLRGADGSASGLDTATGIDPRPPTATLAAPTPEVAATVADSWAQLRKRASVLNLVDVSGSMNEKVAGSTRTKLAAAKTAATAAMTVFTDRDQVGLWTFAGGTGSGPDWTEVVPVGPMSDPVGGTSRRQALVAAVGVLRRAPRTRGSTPRSTRHTRRWRLVTSPARRARSSCSPTGATRPPAAPPSMPC